MDKIQYHINEAVDTYLDTQTDSWRGFYTLVLTSFIQKMLLRTFGNQSKAAKKMDIHRGTLRKYIEKLGYAKQKNWRRG